MSSKTKAMENLHGESKYYELLEDINCPNYTRRLLKGEKIRGSEIKGNWNLAWLNKSSQGFTRFFKLIV